MKKVYAVLLLVCGFALMIGICFKISSALKAKGIGKKEAGEGFHIPQPMGGYLNCNKSSHNTVKGFNFNGNGIDYEEINYTYYDHNKAYDFGSGIYLRRYWFKEAQIDLKKAGKWIVLATGGDGNYDKVILRTLNENKLLEYQFSPENIEHSNLWISSKIKTFINQANENEAFIKYVEDGTIGLTYKTTNLHTEKEDSIDLLYKIDTITGKPELSKIYESIKMINEKN